MKAIDWSECVVKEYDRISNHYDSIYQDDYFLKENEDIIELMEDHGLLRGNILDIGCGTGLVLEYADIPPDRYIGIDPSAGMLNIASKKFPDHVFIQCRIEDITLKCEFDSIMSLFGVFNYITGISGVMEKIHCMLKPGGKYFIMVYQEGRQPVINNYIECGHIEYDKKTIRTTFKGMKKILDFNAYYVIIGEKDA